LREIGADQPTLAATMAAAKHLERALADHDRAIELDPKYAPAYINRADVYRKSGDRDRALADYGKAIELAPNYAFAYGHRGFFLQEVGDVDRALADYNTAIRLNPHYAAAYGARADVLFRKGDLDRAPERAGLRSQLLHRRARAAATPQGRGGTPLPQGRLSAASSISFRESLVRLWPKACLASAVLATSERPVAFKRSLRSIVIWRFLDREGGRVFLSLSLDVNREISDREDRI